VQVQKLKGKLTKSEELTMQQKSKLLAKQVEDTRRELTEGGLKVVTGVCPQCPTQCLSSYLSFFTSSKR